MKVSALIILLICFRLTNLYAQNTDSIRLAKQENYSRLNYDNDFFTATDRYYTQGISIEFIHTLFRKSPFSKTLIPLMVKQKTITALA